MKLILFLIFLISFKGNAYASTYNLTIQTAYVSDNSNFTVKVLPTSKYLKIKPVAESADVFIYNGLTREWVNETKNWDSYPYISENLYFRVNNITSDELTLTFVIHNTKNGNNYSVTPVTLTTHKKLIGYIDNIHYKNDSFGNFLMDDTNNQSPKITQNERLRAEARSLPARNKTTAQTFLDYLLQNTMTYIKSLVLNAKISA